MNFKNKAMIFHVLEKMPMGDKVYYFMQKNLTKSLVMNNTKFMDAFSRKVVQHLKMIKLYGKTKLCEATFFEFGAGWDLLAPIGFSMVGGVNNYICVDLNEFMHKKDILDTIKFYNTNAAEIEQLLYTTETDSLCMERRKIKVKENVDDVRCFLRNRLNIDYIAPCNAGNTELKSNSVDYIVANTTLQHIPMEDVRRILTECLRLLKPEGLLSVTISYIDHYSNTDKSINYYNFLQYSDEEWKKYSPVLHYQNRLRHSDWKNLFVELGFQFVDEKVYELKDEYYKMLDSVRIDKKWESYDREDLVKTGAHFVLGKCRDNQ